MKPLLFIFCLAACCSPSMAQKEWELRLGGGYNFSTASQYILDQVSATSTTSNSRSINSSFGRGFVFNADATCWLNRYFGITAGAGYQTTAPPVKGSYNYFAIDYGYSSSSTWHSRIALAAAGIALKVPDTRLHPYARMGVLLPFYSHLEEDADWSAVYMVGSANGRSHKVFRLRNTAGYNAAVGIAPKLDKHMALFAEVNIRSLAILARHSELTSDMQNGVEKIGTYTTYAKETDYVKKTDGNYQYSDNKPSQQLTFSFPYSSIGIHIGVSFKL